MLPSTFDPETPGTNQNQNAGASGSSSRVSRSAKRLLSYSGASSITDPVSLVKRTCRSASDKALMYREQLGGKGLFLWRMENADLPVPPFQCVTAQVMEALEQHPLDSHRLGPCLPRIVDEPEAKISLANIRERLNALPPSEQTKRDSWLAGLAAFIASEDFYEQVKDSEVARHIRGHGLSTSEPLIVRSSGINEDDYGDAQAGKYLSEVQGEEDVLRTCLKVMASGYRPEVCPGVIPPPMALVIQQCINCQYGGVAMSFQSLQDNTVRVEYTLGQPRGVVAGQSGNTPHRIDIYREDRKEEDDSSQYFPGTISSYFTLRKNDNGYSETRIDDAGAQSNAVEQRLSDDMVSDLREAVTKLEDLLCCPVDVEFGIDHQDRLFLFQVRPITRLSGGMDFAMGIPKEVLAIGDGVSEGYCTGPVWLAKEQAADSMPEGAIVVARHAEDWMLEPRFLERAGGFVTATGGFNDHVAILMKQQRKTLMLAGGQFADVAARVGQKATLACARFNEKPGAFIVGGDITGKLVSHRSLSSAVSDVPLATAVPSWDDLSPSEDTFSQVATGFQWLTDQNARLLAFFASGGGLDCLANPIKLSMSPQRSKLLTETVNSVKRLVHGAEALLDGYHAFLRLAGNRASSEIEILLDELLQLSSRFETLKRTIRSGLKSIILPVQATEKGQLSPGIFRQWVADCHQLQSCLQALDPYGAEQVRSVHELIFALHQRFVKALLPVTVASGQGRISPEQCITYIDCRTLTETEALLSPACKASLDALMILNGVVIIMDEALIVNLRLGTHVSIIELLEHAEGGKGRTLRLKYSDQFGSADDRITRGKFKRMWFLVESLKAIELDENADSIKLNCNAIAGEIIVECPRIRSRPIIREAFVKLTTVLRSLRNLDLFFSQRTIFEGGQWSFNSLVQRLNSGVSAEANRFAFQHCLFLMSVGERIRIDPGYYQLLSNRQRQFIDYGRRLATSKDNFCEVLMSDQHSKEIFRELYHHFLFLDPDKAYQWVELLYPHLKDQYYFIKPSYSYSLEFHLPPAQLSDGQKEKVKSFLLRTGMKYASQRIRNDKELVLAVISLDPSCLEGVSEELKNDKQVVLAAVTIDGDCLQEAGPEPRDNEEVVIAAIKYYPAALKYASDRIRNDKNIIKTLVAFNVSILSYVSKTLLKDRRCMLELIEINPEAFNYAAAGLKDNKAFINEAKQRNPEVRQYLR